MTYSVAPRVMSVDLCISKEIQEIARLLKRIQELSIAVEEDEDLNEVVLLLRRAVQTLLGKDKSSTSKSRKQPRKSVSVTVSEEGSIGKSGGHQTDPSQSSRESPGPSPAKRTCLNIKKGEVRRHPTQRSGDTGHYEPATFVPGSVTGIDKSVVMGKLHDALLRLDGSVGSECYLKWVRSSSLFHCNLADVVERLVRDDVSMSTEGSLQGHFLALQKILRFPSIVAKYADHYVGRYLRKLGTTSRLELVKALCNKAEENKVEQCCRFATECGCEMCQSFIAKSLDRCCAAVQILTLLNNRRFVNLTPTYLYQCLTLSKKISVHSPLLLTPESSTDVRILICNGGQVLEKAKEALQEASQPCGPMLDLGILPTFSVSGVSDHQQAILYCDGDGGYLVVEFLTGLRDYCHANDIPGHKIRMPNGKCLTCVPFREAYHDAVELGHSYKFVTHYQTEGNPRGTCVVSDVGYLALCFQRKLVGNSSDTKVVVHEVLQSGSAHRMLVEVVATIGGVQKVNGLCAVQEGYSFSATLAKPVTPKSYVQAELDAKQQNKGLWHGDQCFHQMVEKVKPWVIKSQLRCAGNCVREETADVMLEIRNETMHLNQSHLIVAESTIQGAGLGLFIRPPASGEIKIPKKTQLCLYDHPAEHVDPESDYYLVRVKGRTTLQYDAKHITGENIGRYVNQGGLIDGLSELCMQATQFASLKMKDIRTVVSRRCNVEFTYFHTDIHISTTEDIVLCCGQPAVELLVDYGIDEFWIPRLLKSSACPDTLSFLQKAVLWPLYSPQSRLNGASKRKYANVSVPDAVMQHVRHLQCPVNLSTARRRVH